MFHMDILYIRYIAVRGDRAMRIAVIGSRGLTIDDLSSYLPPDVTQIISGGARGIDACARAYAQRQGIPYEEFLPDYARYGKAAPLRRNEAIIAHADFVIAFWDGTSRGTEHAVACCRKAGVPVQVYHLPLPQEI